MDFKQFYKEVIFDIDNNMNTLYSAKQGDTKSRGFYVTLTQNNIVVPVTTQSMTFYAEKPDGTRVFQNAIKDGDKFRIDISNQVFATKGIVKCELALRGSNGEKISSKTFKMMIEEQLVDDSIMSADDIGIVDNALDLLAGYQGAITTVEDNLVAHMADNANPHPIYAKKIQAEWIVPTLVSGWLNNSSGSSVAGYFKDNFGIVHLKGTLTAGSRESTIFNLPPGFRPALLLNFSTLINGMIGEVRIMPNGNVIPSASADTKLLFLDGITFKI